MEISGVGIGNSTLGITFATISHPNTIKKLDSIISKVGSVIYSKLVLFIILLATISMCSTTATITWLTIPLLLKLSCALWNASLVTGCLAMIKTMISTTVESCNDAMMHNPFVGGYKVVVQIIGITENTFDFGNSGFRRRRTIGWGCNEGTWGEVIISLLH